jgi:hypothetical protein
MTLDEMMEKARARVAKENAESNGFKANARIFENIMQGTVVRVDFTTETGKDDHNLVHFGPNGMRTYRWSSDVLRAVSGWREPVWFFRFIELAGIGGVIAFFLILVFSVLLCVLAFDPNTANSTVLEVVKLSFTIILGFFFGSQSAGKKSA